MKIEATGMVLREDEDELQRRALLFPVGRWEEPNEEVIFEQGFEEGESGSHVNTKSLSITGNCKSKDSEAKYVWYVQYKAQYGWKKEVEMKSERE